MNYADFLIGLDPEYFVRNKLTGELVCPEGLIKGNKETPFPVPEGAIQVDGLAVEYNIDPIRLGDANPLFHQRVDNVEAALEANLGDEYKLERGMSSFEFSERFFNSLPAEQRLIGCEPDFNPYTGKMNEIQNPDSRVRGAGGHIHIGWGTDIPVEHPDHILICSNFAKLLDASVGCASILFDEEESQRREISGRAGSFRPKPYGMEYRVASSNWLMTYESRRMMIALIGEALSEAAGGRTLPPGSPYEGIINNNDAEGALDVIQGRYFDPEDDFDLGINEDYRIDL